MKKTLCILLVLLMTLGTVIGCTEQQTAASTPPTANETAKETTAPADTTVKDEEPTQSDDKPVAASMEPIKIGVVASLAADGKLAMYFSEISLDMIEDYVSEYDLGGRSVEFIRRDCGSDGSTLKQRMTELKELGCVSIIAGVTDDFGPVVAQWASENKMPVLYTSNYSTEMSITNYSDYIFATGINAWGFIKIMAQEAVGKRGLKNYAYVGSDGAAAIDAENILLYEGQKIDPSFHSVASYRLAQGDSDFSTIIATLISQAETPQMTLQQGGAAVIAFVMQATMYDYYSYSGIWSDVITAPYAVPALAGAGVYNYEGSYGITQTAWWNDDFKAFCDAFTAKGVEVYDTVYDPVAPSIPWAGRALLTALQSCIAAGEDFTNGDVLKAALEQVSFTDCGSEHHFRDFDHQLTQNLYFIDAVDAGEEHNHLAMPADLDAVYTAEDYLPSMEEMKVYGEQYLGVTNRFN